MDPTEGQQNNYFIMHLQHISECSSMASVEYNVCSCRVWNLQETAAIPKPNKSVL